MRQFTGVEIAILQRGNFRLHLLQEALLVIESFIDALDVEVLGALRGIVETETLEGANSGHDAQKRSQEARSEPGPLVAASPRLFVIGTRQPIEKFSLLKIRRFAGQLLSVQLESHFRHARNELAYGPPVRT